MTEAPDLINVIAVRTPEIAQQLQWTGFRRLNLAVKMVDTREEIINLVQAEKPQLILLASELPDTDPFDLSHDLKTKHGCDGVPIVIHSKGAISRQMHEQITRSQCDELLIGSLTRGQLYETIAPHLNLATRSDHRVQVSASVTVKTEAQKIEGRVFDLTVSGARLILNDSPKTEELLTIIIRSECHPEIETVGRLVWCTERGKDAEVAVQFVDVSEETRIRLEQATSWEISTADAPPIVRILRGLTERTNLDGLAGRLGEKIDFDLGTVQTVTSFGISKWVNFLRSIPEASQYRLIRCSTTFCTQASYVTDMIGRGEVVSVYAPYYSAKYDYEAERELVIADFGDTFPPQPPTLPCPVGDTMEFDDIPQRYFHFLMDANKPSADS